MLGNVVMLVELMLSGILAFLGCSLIFRSLKKKSIKITISVRKIAIFGGLFVGFAAYRIPRVFDIGGEYMKREYYWIFFFNVFIIASCFLFNKYVYTDDEPILVEKGKAHYATIAGLVCFALNGFFTGFGNYANLFVAVLVSCVCSVLFIFMERRI